MDNINELINESREILVALHNKELEDKKINNQDELRSEISTFIASQMQTIKHQDTLRALIESELAKSIMLHELSPEQLQSLYATISNEKSKNTNALLEMFKPTQTNSLMLPPSREEETENVSLTSEQRNAIDKLSKVLASMEKKRELEEK